MANQINFRVGYTVDKNGLNEITSSLQAIQKLTSSDLMSLNKGMDLATARQQLVQVKETAGQVQKALSRSFNADLGTLNVSKFNQELKNLNLNKVYKDFSSAGEIGKSAFRNITSQVLTTNMQLKQTHSLLDKMGTTLGNTIKWTIASSAINNFTSGIQEAFNYVIKLDSSLNDIRIVTGKSADEMTTFAEKANETAKQLSASTRDITEGALIYYQQGDDDATSMAKAEITQKAANVSQISSEEASEYLTAVWNGYKVANEAAEEGIDVYEEYVDKLAAVAAETASDLEESSIAMSKVASTANAVGVDFDQLNAQIATIVSVTRQAPETVGNALKTIYARISDLQLNGEDENGVTLGNVSGQLEKLGVSILDETGNLRGMGDVLEDVSKLWQDLGEGEKSALAQAMGGKYQYNTLISLLDNMDMYNDALETSENAIGTLDEQQDIYAERTSAHVQDMKTSFEDLYDSLIDTGTINAVVDAIGSAMSGLSNFIDGIGGGKTALLGLGSVAAQVFSKQIAQNIATSIINIKNAKSNLQDLNAQAEILKQFRGVSINDQNLQTLINMKQQIIDLGSLVTNEQQNEANSMIATTNDIYNQRDAWEANKQSAEAFLQQVSKSITSDISFNKKSSLSGMETKDLEELSRQLQMQIESYQSAIKEAKSYSDTVERLEEALAEQAGAENKAAAGTKELEDAEDRVVDTIIETKAAMKSIKAESQEVLVMIDKESGAYSQLREAIRNYNLALKSQDDDAIAEAAAKLVNAYKAANKQLIGQAKETKDIIEEEIRGTSQSFAEQVSQIQQKYNEFINNLKITQVAQQFVQLLSGVGQLATGIQSLSNLKSIWTDEDLSTGEKVVQILSAFSLGLSTMFYGIKQIRSSFSGLGAIMVAYVSKLDAATLAAYGLTAGEITAGQAAKVLGVQIWAALSPILPIILAVSAAIAAVTAGVYLGVKAWNADADAAKDAVEAAKNAAEAASDAKAAYEELTKTFDTYNSAVNKLNDLAKGTDEWKEALQEANDAAMDLIKSNSSLAQYASRGSNGLITFSDEAENEIIKAKAKANMAAAASNIAQADSNEASLKSQRTNLRRSQNIGYNITTYDGQSTWFQISDAQLQAVISSIQENGGLLEEDLRNIDELNNNDELINSIMNADSELIKLAQTTSDLNATNKLLLGEATRDSLEQNGDYANLSESEKNAFATLYENEVLTDEEKAKIEKEVHDEIWQDAAFGGGNENNIHQQYAEARGWTLSKDKAGDKAVYVDEEGNEQTVSDDTARIYLEQLKIAERLGAKTEENKEQYEELMNTVTTVNDNITGIYGENVANIILDSIANGSKDLDFSAIFGEINLDQLKEMQGLSSDELLRTLGISEEQLKSLGYQDVNAFYDAWQEGWSKYDASDLIDKYQQQASSVQSALDILSKGDSSDLSDQQIELLQELEDEYQNLGNIQNQTSHEYLSALREIKEQQESNAMEALEYQKEQQEEQLNDAMTLLQFYEENPYGIDSDTIEKQVEKVEGLLQSLTDTEYQIKVQIDTDLTSDVDDAFGLADELGQLQDLVSEDLVYTFDEAQQIIEQGNGAIFENAKETADNTIEVNKDVLNSYIDNKQSELNADRKSKIEQLELEKTQLQAVKTALTNKLNALEEAANAETATDAATAMAKVQNANDEYDATMDALQKTLNGEADSATETQNINAELYNALGGMYETDSSNEQQAENDATNTQAQNINKRIANVKLLYSAYQQLASQIKASENGEILKNISVEEALGNTGINITGFNTVKGNKQTANTLDKDTLEEKTEDLFNNNYEQYKDTVNALTDSTKAEINAVDGQIGALDAGIAALKSANITLNQEQKNAKTKSSDSDSSKSKSKSKSSKEEQDPETLDYLDEEEDRYHKINTQLTKLEKNLSLVQKRQENLTGNKLIKNLNKQLEILDKQTAAYEEKLKLAKQEKSELKSSLSKDGVKFNEDGTVANYTTALQKKEAYVNKIIAKYNSMSAKEQEKYKDTVEKAKEDYENFKENIDNYDELVSSTIPELKENLQDVADQKVEIQIEKIRMKIEIEIDMRDFEKEWEDFQEKLLDDDDYKGLAKLQASNMQSFLSSDFFSDSIDRVQDDIQRLNTLNASGSDEDGYENNKAQLLEDLQTDTKQLMTNLEELQDYQDKIAEYYLNSIEAVSEALDEQYKIYQNIGDILEHNQKIIGLLYGDDAYEQMDIYYSKMEKNNNEAIKSLKEASDYYYQQYMSETDEEARAKWKEKWESSVSDLNSAVEDATQNIIDKYVNTVDKVIDELNDKITNNLGLDYVGDQWDLINDNAEQYLDTINSMQAIQELENKYLEAIDDEDSIAGQQKLNKLMNEQLEMLKDKEKLTQYDVDRAEKVYEIALKEIALQNAQQNKSTMRLRRDSQGNYSYQYVSDEDSIAKAQQELLEAQNDLYNFDKEAYTNNLNEIYSTYQEFSEKIKELYEDQTLSAEEREQKKLLLTTQYEELINGLTEQNTTIRTNLYDSAFSDLAALYNVDVSNFTNMSKQEQDEIMNSLIPQWTSGVQQMADVFAGDGGFISVCTDGFNDLDQATRDYQSELDDLEASAGVDFESISDGQDPIIEKTETLLEDNEKLIQSYKDQVDAIKEVKDQIDELIGKYETLITTATAAAQAGYTTYQNNQSEDADAADNNSSSGSSSSTKTTGGSSQRNNNNRLEKGDKVTIKPTKKGNVHWIPAVNGGKERQLEKDEIKGNYYVIDYNYEQDFPVLINRSKDGSGGCSYWIKRKRLAGYDTGGYTGNWNSSDGKLALLHQKELVLKDTDTENLLSAVSLVRNIESFISNLNQSVANNIMGLLSGTTSGLVGLNKDNMQIDQNVHIDATFPNVEDSTEIKEAFNNLINTASQYAFSQIR